ncbi:hypothetical protein [Leifsonia lichenia]
MANSINRSPSATRTDQVGLGIPHLRSGEAISLISWRRTRNGWAFDVRSGQYVAHNPTHWLLQGETGRVVLPISEWSLFSS